MAIKGNHSKIQKMVRSIKSRFSHFKQLRFTFIRPYQMNKTPFEKNDAEALKSDWEAVGRDMKTVLNGKGK